MPHRSHLVTWLLLLAMAAALPGVQAWALAGTQPIRLHGCHGAPQPSAPTPHAYRCCVVGHHQALPTVVSMHAPQFVALALLPCPRAISATTASVAHFENVGHLSETPPSLIPLRI